ncbi:MAG: AAA family ATPase [Ectothiorhodospira sp.]
MQLIRLRLEAFGPFTETELVFGDADAAGGLHLIHGPNEAGKSSLLRAMTDLRFGIPAKTPDAFLHPYDRLRISGLFRDEAGHTLGLSRRKGNRNTLQQVPGNLVCPKAPAPATPEQAQALTGGLGRREFEQMFGLDHARLREGGRHLLEGRGELGAALFEASAGTRGIPGVLSQLEADAKAYFNPHGRSVNAVINRARAEMEAQRQVLKAAQIRPAQWQQLQRAHRAAAQDLQDLEEELEGLRRRERELAELRTVTPLLEDLDGLRRELAGLGEVPDLPEDARDRRLAAEQALERAGTDREEARERAGQCSARLSELTVETRLLEHADAIERLAGRLDTVAEARTELHRQQARHQHLAQRLRVRAERIAPGTEAAVLLEGLPSAADRVGLDTALEALPGLAQRLDDRRRRLAQLDRTARESDREPAEVDPAAREALEQALRQARALGDVDARIRDLETVIDAWAREQAQALRDLEQDDIEALRAAHPFLEAEIDEMARTLEDHGAQLERLDREWTQIRAEREEQRLRQEQLAAVGEVVTAETLRAARERRDALWKRIRRDWVEGAVHSGADPQDDPVRAYEQAVDRADHQADQLRADAARAAGIQECRTRIHRMEARLEEITGERQRRQEALETQRTRWEAECARRGLPPLDPAALGQWQQRREAVLEAGGRLERQRLQRDREAAAREAVARALSGALERLGQRPPGADLGALIRTATDWEHEATARDARREERRHAARERDRDGPRSAVGRPVAGTTPGCWPIGTPACICLRTPRLRRSGPGSRSWMRWSVFGRIWRTCGRGRPARGPWWMRLPNGPGNWPGCCRSRIRRTPRTWRPGSGTGFARPWTGTGSAAPWSGT